MEKKRAVSSEIQKEKIQLIINTTENLAWATHSENTAAYYQNKREKNSQEKREAAAE